MMLHIHFLTTLSLLLPAVAQTTSLHSTTKAAGFQWPDAKATTTIHTVSTIAITATAGAEPDPASYTSQTLFQHDILNATNTYRRQHNASAVTWNTTLATYATSWSSKCIFNHSHPNHFGENLAEGYGSVGAAVDAWGDERRTFDFAHPDFSHATGHFTQLVWKATTQVGCGRMKCDGRNGVSGWYTVCEYSPPGNVLGQFEENVQKQVSESVVNDLPEGYIGGSERLRLRLDLLIALATISITLSTLR